MSKFLHIFVLLAAHCVHAMSLEGQLFELKDFSHPHTGFDRWCSVVNNLYTEKSMQKIKQQDKKWKNSFVSFAEVSYCSNMFSATWSIDRRHAAGNKLDKVIEHWNARTDLSEELAGLIEWLTDMSLRCDDENYCYDIDFFI